jgi:UDP-N-acetylmuramate-alanine ligase
LKILSNFLLSELKQGDMLITIGAGNISKISQLIKEKLEVPINNKI